ncbi:3-oxoacyl-[acyl-carrier-protein] reductase [Colletotrichum higginsianum]|uniref:3-oxoacyl-[acyl-carrier-protein] reductase n=2 Tax=Colletotrichum destructivum species complex TaxID=2707350 RepID=H1VPT4_COLHI|nr:3-oxoacyl-[acyl-carrier-protein] reductase [Colletotrichum higginsianum IMI 349063]OBR16483.1 3-oxoacyl-[acyl-carrier-protein] reductase [Colletotrichum higginsianum IMI 349063]CCF42240.1 3-oxoacyl-[acyl-carrier-protein] reductase [Colletotrichum higginsianum]
MSATHQFRDKVIAVTGAASGIGLATAHLLASRGAKLSLADINAEGLREAQSDIQARHTEAEVITSAVDVTDYDQVEKWTANTIEHFGRLDGAANLAGVIPKSVGKKGLADQDLDEWEFVMGVNLKGVMHCLKAQLSMIQDNGSIVNASSIAGLQGRPNNGAYTASKHAILGLTRTAAKEVGCRSIRVNAVCPGRIDTPMSRASAAAGIQADAALGRSGRPEEVASLIAFLLSSESTYITGSAISIDGGWNC